MKLENQVCLREQGQRLAVLGVTQQSAWHHVAIKTKEGIKWFLATKVSDVYIVYGTVSGQELPHYDESVIKECYSAYTVSELGVMLPELYVSGYTYKRDSCICCHYKEAARKGSNDRYEKWMGKGNTEAEARAALLMYLLENNLTTPEEVNQRLLNA